MIKLIILAGAILAAILIANSLFFSERLERPNEAVIVVEVRNGCGTRGLGDKVASYLRDEGFDVILVGNAEDFEFKETMVVDRSGEWAKAREVARVLGGVPVVRQISSGTLADATVIVGRDFEDFE
ncbi:MAG: LytR C-terminal domain-containing protein [bacterium]